MEWLPIMQPLWHIIIMYVNRISITFTIFFCLLILTVPLAGQDRPYQVDATGGIGYNRFISSLSESGLNKNGFNGTVRLMWQPEHLLSLGFETGYIQLHSLSKQNTVTEYGSTNINTRLSTVPLLIIYRMAITSSITLNAGTGGFLLYSHVESHGNIVSSNEFSTGYLFSVSYLKNIHTQLKLGAEINWVYLNKIEDGAFLFQLIIQYPLLTW